MGRLWQTLILSRWRPLFADVRESGACRQEDYYRAIERSTKQASATPFVELMLGLIRTALDTQPEQASAPGQGAEQATEQAIQRKKP
jgi:hypothetical protein